MNKEKIIIKNGINIYVCACGNYNKMEYTDNPEDGYYCECAKCGKYHFILAEYLPD